MQSLQKIDRIEDRYELGKFLGQGSVGQVHAAKHKKIHLSCAVKIVPKDKMR